MVDGYAIVEGYICLNLKIPNSEITCPYCQKPTRELHQIRSMLVRDLPTFGQPVYLKVPRRQFYCRYCQKYVTEKLNFVSSRRPYSHRYESYIYERVLMSNMSQVGREENLTPDQVESIFNFVSQSLKKKSGD
jgi:transposase